MMIIEREQPADDNRTGSRSAVADVLNPQRPVDRFARRFGTVGPAPGDNRP